MSNIKKDTKEFLSKTKEYCDTKRECNGCFFNIDLGSMGEECRLDKLNELFE